MILPIYLVVCLAIYIAGVVFIFCVLSCSPFIKTDRLKTVMYVDIVFNYVYIGLYVYRYIYAILWPVCLSIYILLSLYRSIENFMMDPILIEDFTRLVGKDAGKKGEK